MSISCSIESEAPAGDADAAGDLRVAACAMIIDTTTADASVTVSKDFITRQYKSNFPKHTAPGVKCRENTPIPLRRFGKVCAHYLQEEA